MAAGVGVFSLACFGLGLSSDSFEAALGLLVFTDLVLEATFGIKGVGCLSLVVEPGTKGTYGFEDDLSLGGVVACYRLEGLLGDL